MKHETINIPARLKMIIQCARSLGIKLFYCNTQSVDVQPKPLPKTPEEIIRVLNESHESELSKLIKPIRKDSTYE